MKIFTVATRSAGYYELLRSTAENWGYNLITLGWQQEWKGFTWKIELYIEALAKLEESEIVICVDGYDVVVVGSPEEAHRKFNSLNQPILFSGQRYFPNHRWLQKMADKVMSNNIKNPINKKLRDTTDYSRPCMGLLMAYAGDLKELFEELLKIEKKHALNDDQTLLNMYYLDHPDSIELDRRCEVFQNLWRTRMGVYGKISTEDRNCEVEIFVDPVSTKKRLRNKAFHTFPCFVHGPLNLNMTILLQELGLEAPKVQFQKGLSYLSYSIVHHINRALKLFFPNFKRILLGILIIALLYFIMYKVF